MGPSRPLSTPNAAKFAASLRCGLRVPATVRAAGSRRTRATFLPRCSLRGKACGHSSNQVTLKIKRVGAFPETGAGGAGCVLSSTGVRDWGGPWRTRATAKR
jgi:hypothetical protein